MIEENWNTYHIISRVQDWLECSMETDANITELTTDEMYMMLQKDMVEIKAKEQALQSEIVNIKSKFSHLLQTCGLEDEFPVDVDVRMSTPRRPSHTTNTNNNNDGHHHGGTPRRTNYNYADFLIDQLLAGNSTLTDSDLSISPEDTRNSAEVEAENLNAVDTYCNALSAASNQNFFHSDSNHVAAASTPQPVSNCKVMPNNIDVTTSENGVATTSSSDSSCPQTSSDSSDNQVVPDLDLEKELVSRVQYYSDFTIDRQRKINQLLLHIKQNNNSTMLHRPEVAPGGNSTVREVEGAEQRVSFSNFVVKRPSSSTTSTPCSGTDSTSSSRKSSRHGSRSKTSSSRTSSHPLMSSTLISDPSNVLPSSSSNSSVYTWSIDENSDPADLQGSYLRSRRSSQHRSHRVRKSTSSGTPRLSSERRHRRHQRNREAPSLHLTHMVSTIETSVCSSRVFAENNHQDRGLPRCSTKAELPIINNSSWDKNPVHSTSDAKFVSIQPSDVSDTFDSSPLQERLDLPGKSSSSGSSAGRIFVNPSNTQASAMTTMNTTTDCSRMSSMNETSLIDTVLTDSPADSVNSSGIFAPCNSPHYSSVGSHCGYTTVSSSVPSSSSNECRAPAPTMVKLTDPIFKIPHSPIGRKRSSRKTSSHSPSVRTSTPRPPYYPGSVHSEPVMRRKLFSPGTGTGTPGEHRILDKKALVRKFKKFSHHFYKSDRSNKIKTLANL